MWSDLTATGGASTGTGGETSASGGATGGSADRGTGGTVAGNECTRNDQCATPALCKVCSAGGSTCAQGECANGTCTTYFPPCGVLASGGASGAGGATGGSAGMGAGGDPSTAGECQTADDCAAPALCKECPAGGSTCEKAECLGHQCSTYFPPCTSTATGGASGVGGTSGSGGAATGGATNSSPCSMNSDCADHEICGFPTADACAAKGTCFPAPGVECDAILPGCACDGSMVNLACNGLPSGYAPKPLLHSGECTN